MGGKFSITRGDPPEWVNEIPAEVREEVEQLVFRLHERGIADPEGLAGRYFIWCQENYFDLDDQLAEALTSDNPEEGN